jgi:hypothetical protein
MIDIVILSSKKRSYSAKDNRKVDILSDYVKKPGLLLVFLCAAAIYGY